MTTLTIIALIFGIPASVATLLGWLKVTPDDLRKFIAIRGRTIAWSVYIIIAALLTAYFLVVSAILLVYVKPLTSAVAMLLLMIVGLLGIWSPAIQRFGNKRLNIAVQITMIGCMALTIGVFWIVQPDWQLSALLSVLFILGIVYYLIERIREDRKRQKSLREAPFVACPNCGKKTRMRRDGHFHCRFCKTETQFPRSV